MCPTPVNLCHTKLRLVDTLAWLPDDVVTHFQCVSGVRIQVKPGFRMLIFKVNYLYKEYWCNVTYLFPVLKFEFVLQLVKSCKYKSSLLVKFCHAKDRITQYWVYIWLFSENEIKQMKAITLQAEKCLKEKKQHRTSQTLSKMIFIFCFTTLALCSPPT